MNDKILPELGAPLFVVGCPRAGLSLLVEILASHENLGWISKHTDRFASGWKATAALNRVYDLPLVGQALYRVRCGARAGGAIAKALPYPAEAWNFWQSRISRFTPKDQGLWVPEAPVDTDIEAGECGLVRRDVSTLLSLQGRSRLLSYHGGHGRMRLLSVPFPDARFVQVTRDARAVVESFHRMVSSGEFRTWEERDRWPRVWPERWQREFRARHYDQFGLCVYLWMHFTTSIRQEGRQLSGNRYLEIRYEDLIRNPVRETGNVLEFCGLPASSRVSAIARNLRPASAPGKWKTAFTSGQLRVIDEILEPDLRTLLEDE